MQIVETICMKWQMLFSGKKYKNITNLLSAELACRVAKVEIRISRTLQYFDDDRWNNKIASLPTTTFFEIPLRKHAYLNILKILLPKNEN